MTVPYTFATQSGNIPLAELDANFANVKAAADTAGVVTANAQPNINSVGVLTRLSVSGNIIAIGNVTAGNVVANNFIGNIVGNITNAVYATTAGLASTANTVVLAAQTNITSVGTLTGLSVSGNTISGNFRSSGSVSATGNVTGNYVIGNGSRLSNLTGANVTGTVALATDANTAGTVTTNSQPNITSVGTLTSVTATGNIRGGNLDTAGTVVAGAVSAAGTVLGGNLRTTGFVSAIGNIITSGYFVGNFAGNISGNLLVPGANTQVIYNNNGNAGASAGLTFDSASNVLTVTGTISASSSINSNNISVVNNLGAANINAGVISAAGTVTVDSSVFAGNLFAYTGDILGANVKANLVISSAGNVIGANILTAGQVSAAGNITGANIATGGTISSTGNVRGANFNTTGLITATGNITGAYFIGNGSQLTGVATSSNAASLTGNTLSSNVVNSSLTSIGTLTTLSVVGNVTANNFVGAGAGTPTISSNAVLILSSPSSVRVQGGGTFRLPSLTSAQIANLTSANGDMIYNSTINKFQGYENGAWGNLI